MANNPSNRPYQLKGVALGGGSFPSNQGPVCAESFRYSYDFWFMKWALFSSPWLFVWYRGWHEILPNHMGIIRSLQTNQYNGMSRTDFECCSSSINSTSISTEDGVWGSTRGHSSLRGGRRGWMGSQWMGSVFTSHLHPRKQTFWSQKLVVGKMFFLFEHGSFGQVLMLVFMGVGHLEEKATPEVGP